MGNQLPLVQPPHCRFYVARHGESEANVQRYLAGHLNPRLTLKGKQQARERVNDFKDVHFADIFSSDLLRAHQTAKILAKQHQLVVKTTQALRERSYGKYEGSDYDQYNAQLREWLKEYEGLLETERTKQRWGGEVESDDELYGRAQLFFRELAVANPGKNILVVCHGGIMREFLIRVGYGAREEVQPGAVKNLAYFIIDCDGVEFYLRKTEGIEKDTE